MNLNIFLSFQLLFNFPVASQTFYASLCTDDSNGNEEATMKETISLSGKQ